jgi:hypothetical protein
MISDLSPGDKLSLKGKLFELRKRLNIIEFENQRQDDYSFRPTLEARYKLADRSDFYHALERAEMARQQNIEILKATLRAEENCTFSPHINRLNYGGRRGNKEPIPAHERLYQKGLEYRANHKSRVYQSHHYDDSGRKLFQPEISRLPYKFNRYDADTMPADEYLYRDARDREYRQQQRDAEVSMELEVSMGSRKMNARSSSLLKRRAEREIREVFEFIDSEGHGVIRYDDLQKAVDKFYRAGFPPAPVDDKFKFVEKVWESLDERREGIVSVTAFIKICYPLVLRDGPNTASFSATLASTVSLLSKATLVSPSAHTVHAQMKALKHLLDQAILYLQKRAREKIELGKDHDPKTSFHLSKKSQKLAESKLEKEKVLLMKRAEERRQPLSKRDGAVEGVHVVGGQSSTSGDETQVADYLRVSTNQLPPPPPPTSPSPPPTSSSSSHQRGRGKLHGGRGSSRRSHSAPSEPTYTYSADDAKAGGAMNSSRHKKYMNDTMISPSHHDLLHARAEWYAEKLAAQQHAKDAREAEQCTFKPSIPKVPKFLLRKKRVLRNGGDEHCFSLKVPAESDVKDDGDDPTGDHHGVVDGNKGSAYRSNLHRPVYERLYGEGIERGKRQEAREIAKNQIVDDSDGFENSTFQPSVPPIPAIYRKNADGTSVDKGAAVTATSSYKDAVARIRQANDKRKKDAEEIETFGACTCI